jgi:hypothetical protein
MKKIITAALITFVSYSVSTNASTLNTQINMDNGFEVYLSTDDAVQGTLFGTGNDWGISYSNSTLLSTGVDYYLHVFGYDQGGIAGFLGQFSLASTDHIFSNGGNILLTNTTDWQGNNTGWGNTYTLMTSSGANGVGPWGSQPAISGTSQWIWAGDSDAPNETLNEAYFSTKISATSTVPESPAPLLFGASLLGLFGMRQKHKSAT